MWFPSLKFCTLGALVIGAPQASAQTPENEIANWTMEFNGFNSEFRRGEQYEISLDYTIGTGRSSYKVTPMETGCKTELDIVGQNETLNEAVDDVQELKILLDLNKAGLVNSPIWNSEDNSVYMCMRIELYSGDMVIKRDERDIKVNLNFRVEFTTIEDANMTKLSLPTGDNGEPFEGLLQLTSIGILDVTGYDTTGVEGDHPIIQVFQTAFENFQKEQGVEFKLTNFDDAMVSRSLRQRQLQTDGESFEVGFVTEFSNYCDGTTDCAGDSLGTFYSVRDDVYGSVFGGSFTSSVQEIAAAQGTGGVDDMNAISVIMFVPEVRLIGFSQTTATVENYVEACTCYGSNNFDCNTNLLGPDDYLNVCIKSLNTEMEIDDLDNITVTQNTLKFDIVKSGDLMDNTISSKTKVTQENGMHVASIIPAAFFSYESNTVAEVTGVAYLKLANSRRRLAVELSEHSDVDATGSTRALATPLGATETGFAVNVVLAKNEFDVSLGEDGANTSTSANVNVMMTSIIVASAAAAVAIMAFFFVKKSRGLDKNLSIAKPASSVI